MDAMEGTVLLCPGRARMIDLIAADGLSSDSYNDAVTTLSQSLAKYNFAIIQLPIGDDVLVKCVLDSARMFFHQRPIPSPGSQQGDQVDWNRSSGYYAQPHHVCEVYDYRPGYPLEVQTTGEEYPPVGLPELFSLLGKASRQLLDAIGRSLDLRSFCFTDLLDNTPLKSGEFSTSVLSVCCHARPGIQGDHLSVALSSNGGHMPLYDHEPYTEKGLLTLVKSDKPGLHIRDVQGRWLLADGDLGPHDMVLYTGLALYQCTAGYVSPALLRYQMEVGIPHNHMSGRCSISYKLMPRPSSILHCSAMTAAGHGVSGPFQQPVAVCDFMQRTYPMDQLVNRLAFSNYGFQAPSDGAMKAVIKRRKQLPRGKPLAPSKRLRLEAQRVLKERVQEIADNKGIKIRFCSLKDCEEQHISSLESPCASVRAEIGWPAGVPFVHPHDLPNKAKQAFLEAYEPGWTASQNGEMGLGHSHLQTHVY